MRSAIPAFQDALKTVVRASIPAAVRVTLGYPTGTLEDLDVVLPGETTVEVDAGVSGMRQRDETLRTEVRCWAELITDDYLEARDAALALSNAVDDGVAADPTLGGVVESAHVSEIRMQEGMTDNTRQCGITLVVTAVVTVA